MSAQSDKTQINAEASRWASQRSLEGFSGEQQADFDAWYAARPEHRTAFQRANETMLDMSSLAASAEGAALRASLLEGSAEQDGPARGWFGKWFVPAGLVAAACAFAYFSLLPISGQIEPAHYKTAVAEMREVTLPDGSQVTLGARSELVVTYSDDARQVQLREGEAFFSVEADAARPFEVQAKTTVVRVLGTRFDVHLGKRRDRVAVLDGVVEVRGQRLRAGEQLIAPRDKQEAVIKTQVAEQPGHWRDGRFVYEAVPLIEVVADANRYYQGTISLASEDIADMLVTTSFKVTQIDQMLNTLTVALPLDVQRTEAGNVLLAAR